MRLDFLKLKSDERRLYFEQAAARREPVAQSSWKRTSGCAGCSACCSVRNSATRWSSRAARRCRKCSASSIASRKTSIFRYPPSSCNSPRPERAEIRPASGWKPPKRHADAPCKMTCGRNSNGRSSIHLANAKARGCNSDGHDTRTHRFYSFTTQQRSRAASTTCAGPSSWNSVRLRTNSQKAGIR